MSPLHRNILWLFVSQIATWMVSIVLLILAPSRLGSEDFGRISFVTAFLGFFNLVGMLGSYQYLVKRIARDHSEVGRLVVDALQLKLVVGLFLSAVALTLGWLLSYSTEVLVLIFIGCMAMTAGLLNDVLISGLAGMERMAGTAFWATVQVYVGSALTIVVLLTSHSLVLFSLAIGIAVVVPLTANYLRLRSFIEARGPRVSGSHRTIVLGGLPFVVLTGLNLIYGTIDVPILESISGSTVVGWYTLAYRWISMPIFITTIVITAFLPSLSEMAGRASLHEFTDLTNRAVRLVMIVSIPASVGLIFVAPDILHLLYGSEFNHSVVLMRILSIHIPIAAMDTVLALALIAADRQNRYLIVALCAAIINPPLDFLAIHITADRYGNGAIGAAIVTVLTEVFIALGALKLRSPGVMNRRTVLFIGRCLIAVGAMSVVLAVSSDFHLFVKIVAGGVVYALASLALGTVSISRIKGMMAELGRSQITVPQLDEASQE